MTKKKSKPKPKVKPSSVVINLKRFRETLIQELTEKHGWDLGSIEGDEDRECVNSKCRHITYEFDNVYCSHCGTKLPPSSLKFYPFDDALDKAIKVAKTR